MTDLPLCGGHNALFVVVDRLTKFCILIPCLVGEGALSAKTVAQLFFDHVVRWFGVPQSVLHDRDPRFTGLFWRELWRLLGTRVLLSCAYHPQTDG